MNPKLLLLTITCLCLSLSIITPTQAQSKDVKENLQKADRLFANSKLEDARTLYKQYAASLSAEQQIKVGIAYLATANGKQELLAQGINWFEKSASAGSTEAMNYLAHCYGNGIGVSRDREQEVHWLTKSADKGDNAALLVLGLRYQAGLGVTENQEKAYELFRLSADKGNAQAAYYVSATNRFENPGTDTWYWLKKSAKGGYVPGMLQLGKLYEETGDTDEAVRWYTAIAKTEGNDVEHQVAAKRKKAIGKLEPPTDISIVKPQLLKLISSAANDYSGTLRWETEPLEGNRVDVLSTSTYYTTILETGFKNALVRKEVVQARDLGNVQVKAGTYWSYSADIVYSVNQETSLRVFEQWVTMLKTVLKGWEYDRGGTSARPLFTIKGKVSNGKNVAISMSVSGLNSENVGIHISNRD